MRAASRPEGLQNPLYRTESIRQQRHPNLSTSSRWPVSPSEALHFTRGFPGFLLDKRPIEVQGKESKIGGSSA